MSSVFVFPCLVRDNPIDRHDNRSGINSVISAPRAHNGARGCFMLVQQSE